MNPAAQQSPSSQSDMEVENSLHSPTTPNSSRMELEDPLVSFVEDDNVDQIREWERGSESDGGRGRDRGRGRGTSVRGNVRGRARGKRRGRGRARGKGRGRGRERGRRVQGCSSGGRASRTGKRVLKIVNR